VLVKLRQMIAAGSIETDTMLGAITVAAHSLTGASGAAMAMPREGGVICVGRSGETAPQLGTHLNLNAGIAGECLRQGRILCSGDAAREFRVDPELCRQMGLKSIAVVPLHGLQGRIGVLEVFSSEPCAFTQDHMDLLGRLAELAEAAWARQEQPRGPVPAAMPDSVPDRQTLNQTEGPKAAVALARVGEALASELRAELAAERRWRYGTAAALAGFLLLLLGLFVWRAWHKASLQFPSTRTTAGPGNTTPESPDRTAGVGLEGQTSAAVSAAPPGSFPPTAETSEFSADAAPDLVISRRPVAVPAPDRPTPEIAPPPASAPSPAEVPPIAGSSTAPDDLGSALATAPVMPQLAAPIAQGMAGGILLHKVQPVYPAEARQAHLEGTVVLDLTITQRGQVEEIKLVSGPALLARAAIEAVGQWRYVPYVLDGRPIRKPARISITFKLAQ
jgi:protein TonB